MNMDELGAHFPGNPLTEPLEGTLVHISQGIALRVGYIRRVAKLNEVRLVAPPPDKPREQEKVIAAAAEIRIPVPATIQFGDEIVR